MHNIFLNTSSEIILITEKVFRKSIRFTSSSSLSLGVELELQLIDPETLDLSPRSIELLQIIGEHPNIVQEVMQSMLEIKTDICRNAREAEYQLQSQCSPKSSIN